MALRGRDVLLAVVAFLAANGLVTRYLPVPLFLGLFFLAGALVGAVLLVALVAFATLTSSRRPRRSDDPRREGNQTIAFLRPQAWKTESTRLYQDRAYNPEKLYPQSFVVSDAIDGLIALVLRDFVTSWYNNISKDPTFSNEIDKGIRAAVGGIRDRLFREDMVTLGVSRIVPIITQHLEDFEIAERLVRGKSLNRNVTESEELDMAIAAKYKEGKLHPAASLTFSDTKIVQQDHIRKILVRILPKLVPEALIKSRAVSVLIKEIVACAVLFPISQMMIDPDFWNQMIEGYGRTALQDRKTVQRLRAALDEHASPVPASKQSGVFPKLKPGDSERAFERFVRAIRHCNNLSDARRFRSLVASQLKRESQVEGQDQTYLRRLETGKRVLDQKVIKLAARSGSVQPSRPLDQRDGHSNANEASLVDVMHKASGLSYFMEFMDRQNKMVLVQFWVVVDGFRNPLEDDFGDEADSDSFQWTDADRNDVASIKETYLSRPELHIPEESKKAVKTFLAAGRQATPLQYRQARTAILSAQSAAYEEMQTQHFPNFKKSDLYYKYLTSDETSTPALTVNQPQLAALPPVTKPTPLPPLRTSSSKQIQRSTALRRAAVSATDVRVSSKLFEEEPRRSFDTDRSAPLMDEDDDTDPLAGSTFSLGSESQNGETGNQNKMIENMEVALNNIISEDPTDDHLEDTKDALFGSPPASMLSGKTTDSPRGSLDFPRTEPLTGDKTKPSIASLGLVNSAGRIGVFTDNDLFGDEEKFIEDEYVDSDENKGGVDEQIHEAAPGDLGLAEAIVALSTDIERLTSQESVLDALTRKAELTNNVAELRILGKSKSSLQREIRRKELQRQQYIVQESDNSLYGRATIRIKSIVVGKEDDGREFALYVIEVQRKAGDAMPAASWVVPRRYSEFHELYRRLKARYPSTRELEFPSRRVVMKLQKDFLHKRRIALEEYLRQLLLLPDVCRSRELRAFLSQQALLPEARTADGDANDIVSRIYGSVTGGMEDFMGNLSVFDQLSVAGQNLISAATTQLSTVQTGIIPDATDPKTIAEAEAELNAFEDRELEPFVKPICDLFLETFDLNKGNNWLRGRAVVVVLHQLLGGTVERKVREIVKTYTTDDSLLKYISILKDNMWPLPSSTAPTNIPTTALQSLGAAPPPVPPMVQPDDSHRKMRGPVQPRTANEKAKTRTEASVLLATLIPDLAGNVVGRFNAQQAARKIAAMLNNRRLNTHLVFTILDEIVTILFEDVNIRRRSG